MGRRRTTSSLHVLLNGRTVGELVRESGGGIRFTYDDSWLEWESALPISLSLPLQAQTYKSDAVVHVLDNMLPDDREVRNRIAERLGAAGTSAFDLLSIIGRDCVGALQFLPPGTEVPQQPDTLPAQEVTESQIESMIADLARSPLGVKKSMEFRISIAGAHEKTALLRRNGKWFIPVGTTPTTHIVKPQIGRLWGGFDFGDSVENEHLCLRILAKMGLPVPDTEIVDFGETRALVVQRFDRRWTSDGRILRIPQEDFCQVFSISPGQKYESDGGPGMVSILGQLRKSDAPRDDQVQFTKAQYVFWLIGATDGHAKNFSVSLRPGGSFRLTPFYDVISAQPHLDDGHLRRKEYRLAMAVGDSRHYRIFDICKRHFVETGSQAGIPSGTVEGALEEIRELAVSAMEQAANELPSDFPEELVNSVAHGMKRRLG